MKKVDMLKEPNQKVLLISASLGGVAIATTPWVPTAIMS